MKRRSASDLFLVGLATIALVQAGMLVVSAGAPAITPGTRPTVGDVVGALAAAPAVGQPVAFASQSSEPTLLMVFHSECGHCKRVAPAWRDWLERDHDGLRILAVTTEPAEVGVAYAREHGWRVTAASVSIGELGSTAHGLMSRTPWLFLLDGDGVIRFEAQGANLDALDAAIQGIGTAAADRP